LNKKQNRNWRAISANSRFLIVPGSDHLSLLKEYVAAVSDAIIRMVRGLIVFSVHIEELELPVLEGSQAVLAMTKAASA
jgi:hypothetical protein